MMRLAESIVYEVSLILGAYMMRVEAPCAREVCSDGKRPHSHGEGKRVAKQGMKEG